MQPLIQTSLVVLAGFPAFYFLLFTFTFLFFTGPFKSVPGRRKSYSFSFLFEVFLLSLRIRLLHSTKYTVIPYFVSSRKLT